MEPMGKATIPAVRTYSRALEFSDVSLWAESSRAPTPKA